MIAIVSTRGATPFSPVYAQAGRVIGCDDAGHFGAVLVPTELVPIVIGKIPREGNAVAPHRIVNA
ncbi:hypothetical protein [Ralstonia pseudosolanacearum]|nr:hypothetical protein [Ralstonia pseudosolanacearum]UQY82767.1 hypothetical protein JNO62_00980 [Ralstonia pseudosolanacearum]